jgi:GNAT superfamily N-acetyltransferase
MESQIRLAVKEDADWIKEIYKVKPKEIGDFNQYQTFHFYLTGKATHKFIVIPEKGFVRYGYSPKMGAYIIHEIGVHPVFRRHGVAKVLFDRVKKIAHRSGYRLLLKCNAENETANKFYEKMGMRFVSETSTRKGVKQYLWII